MNERFIWLFAAATVLLSACSAHLEPLKRDDRTELDRWVDDELVPYTVKELSSHPKFKGQPFLIVSMRGDTADASIDELTRDIRRRMVDALLTTPGVELTWPAAYRPWQHFGEMADIPCGEFHPERYYIGLDVQLSPLDATLQVSVRALDLVKNSWVAGFHHSWRGHPTETQLDALSRRRPDENLRGLRASPFEDTELDLMAAYLAHNLRCRLRHITGAEETVIHAEQGKLGGHPFVRRTVGLMTNYLSRLREARITDDPAQATVSLAGEIHLIHDDLYQVWVGVRDARNGRYLPGSETEAYIRLDLAAASGQDSAPATPLRLGSETRTLPRSAKAQDVATSSKGAWMKELGRRTQPATRLFGMTPVTGMSRRPAASSVDAFSSIGSFRLVTPGRRTGCKADWKSARDTRVVLLNEQLTEDACGALEVTIQRPAQMFVLGQSGSGSINWMFPEVCRGGDDMGTPVQKGEVFRFWLSSDQSGQVRLRRGLVDKWLYVIAVADRGEQETSRTLTRLMDGEPLGLCAYSRSHSLSPKGWQRHLDALKTESGGQLEWRAIHFLGGNQRLTQL